MIDSHAHIYLKEFDLDREKILARSNEIGISRIYMPNIDHSSIDAMLESERKYPEMCIPMMGLHPCSVKNGFEKELYIVEEWLAKRKWSAVGEIGLDLYWDQSTLGIQLEALKIQISLAKKWDLPIVLHCRDAFEELFKVLDEVGTDGLKGVFHCFTGTSKELGKINDIDFYIGIGGVLTFKNQTIVDCASEMKLDRILLETDSPYLAPIPFRGKRNEPSYLSYISSRLAEVLQLDEKVLIDQTDKNCLNFFSNIHV